MHPFFQASAICATLLFPISVSAQNPIQPAQTPTPKAGTSMGGDFRTLVWDELPTAKTTTYAPAPTPPQAYNGCLIAEDGVTPIICSNSDVERPLPETVVWRDDPEASPDAPRHCLWWTIGQQFVGAGAPAVCRDGTVPVVTPPVARNAAPLDTPRHRPTSLTRP